MATHRSARKRIRRNARCQQYNRQNRQRMRTAIKGLRSALDSGDLEQARARLVPTVSLIDRLVGKGVVHASVAARTKSRLTRHVNRMEGGAGAR
ncbi:MAG: 30S ribosomal protein S20 [Acidobacteriota bacterium]